MDYISPKEAGVKGDTVA